MCLGFGISWHQQCWSKGHTSDREVPKASWMMLTCSQHWEPSMAELLALGWVLCGHRNEIESKKQHSSNKELLYPKSEPSLSCNPRIFILASSVHQNNPGYSFGRAAHSTLIVILAQTWHLLFPLLGCSDFSRGLHGRLLLIIHVFSQGITLNTTPSLSFPYPVFFLQVLIID